MKLLLERSIASSTLPKCLFGNTFTKPIKTGQSTQEGIWSPEQKKPFIRDHSPNISIYELAIFPFHGM
jgi:hypothetical protein